MWTTTFQFSKTGQSIALHVFGKHDAKHRRPVVIYFHGGLFNCGKVEAAYAMASALSGHAVIVCVDYPLAPSMHFPDTIEVAYESLTWVAKNIGLIGADVNSVFVAGEQAGGNLAAVLAMLCRDRGINHIRLSGQILINPMLDALQTSKSMGATSDSPCRKAWADYIQVTSNATHPYVSPVNSCRLAGLAPALLITSNGNPLRDEAEAYAAKLLLAGVPVKVQRLEEGAQSLVSDQSAAADTACQLIRHFIND